MLVRFGNGLGEVLYAYKGFVRKTFYGRNEN